MPTLLTQKKMRLYISFPEPELIRHCHITFSRSHFLSHPGPHANHLH